MNRQLSLPLDDEVDEIPAAVVLKFQKWLVMWRYSHGYLSHEGAEQAFTAHPEWRSQ